MKKDNVLIRRGTIIRGKWNQQRYRVIRMLGYGAVGTVYLCQHKRSRVAVKISNQPMAMTAEVQVLRALKKVQDMRLGPSLFDADDWVSNDGDTYSFYAMEYVHGVTLRTFIRHHGSNWIGSLLLQLLQQLAKLHEAGWVFGDLKHDNIIVTIKPLTVRLIDVGGTTKIGRAVKEYSNFFDRAYWRQGKRIADPGYDLFAVVMVVLSIYYPQTFERKNNGVQQLRKSIMQVRALHPYRSILMKAIEGKYTRAQMMYDDIVIAIDAIHKKRRTSARLLLMESVLLVGSFGTLFLLDYFLF